jgi:hypothetical protein
VCGVIVRAGRVNGEEEGKRIWLMGFICIYEIDQTSCNWFKWDGEGLGRER